MAIWQELSGVDNGVVAYYNSERAFLSVPLPAGCDYLSKFSIILNPNGICFTSAWR